MLMPVLPLFQDLRRLDASLAELPCPCCAASDALPVWQRDRYFLRVELSICRRCGLAYLRRGLQGEAEQLFYRSLYPRIMRQPPSARDQWHYRLLAGYRYSTISAALGPLDAVLDIGSGLGFFLDACRAHGAERYAGIEPGTPQRSFAAAELGLGEALYAQPFGEPLELPFRPRLVTLFHVLEHLNEPRTALRQVAELMDPDGWLVVEVPDIRADWREMGLIQVHVSHRSYFCRRTLEALLASCGFRVHQVQAEAHGIYPGNLRVYARLDAPAAPAAVPADAELQALREAIRGQIAPASLVSGYPRMAARLLRLALR